MNDKNQMALNNRILEFVGGSHLYGTNTDQSDVDYIGIFIPSEDYVLGYEGINEVDLSQNIVIGKNNKDSIDRKLYEIRRFLKLCSDNNPNKLELLYANDSNIIYRNEWGQKLLDYRDNFPNKGLIPKYLGYATSQRKKMQVRSDSYTDLLQAYTWFSENVLESQQKRRLLGEYETMNLPFITIPNKKHAQHLRIGDLNFDRKKYISQILPVLHNRITFASNRSNLIRDYGYDTKFASHYIRLMFLGIELLETGKMTFPMIRKEELIDIRNGKYTQNNILEWGDELENNIRNLERTTDLPEKCDNTELLTFTKKLLKDYLWNI